MYMHVCIYACMYSMHLPDVGHIIHCPEEANDTPNNSKQHCS